jgi:hypothetical protein
MEMGARSSISEREANMQDRVGVTVPTEAQVAVWVAAINKLRQDMAPYGVSLTPDERRHTLKFRPGGEPIVSSLAAAVREHNVSLPGITADGMQADLLLTQRMKPLRDAAETLCQFADDTMLEASSECWYAATAYYTALSRMVSSFPDLKATIGQIASFFGVRRRQSPQSTPSST